MCEHNKATTTESGSAICLECGAKFSTAAELIADGDKQAAVTDTAVSWLQAVRKFGIERANQMFPEG